MDQLANSRAGSSELPSVALPTMPTPSAALPAAAIARLALINRTWKVSYNVRGSSVRARGTLLTRPLDDTSAVVRAKGFEPLTAGV